ncbi:phosphotransferase family protein [Paenarthrobacter nicotinovorans]|uniref:phosphotransferase family protein n=1 Tax=Paenarthrobacter nicotinovorans TaxID=29320 RepID=UPI0006852C53|nr:aminoglycoside phosphotransferase family protein [Paenarthrobacter nicotinovorans]
MPEGITERQRNVLTSWLGPYAVVQDHSWPLQDTTVLQLEAAGGDHVMVKASTASHHIRREIAAYSRGMPGLDGRVPVLLHASPEAGLLVTRYLPGTVVAGTPSENEPETYRQAGSILAALHQPAGTSHSYVRALKTKTGHIIERAASLLPRQTLEHLTAELEGVTPGPAELVTTHGDYQPRNWLNDDGDTKVIDFGRADLRPWVHDLVRLSHQQFLGQERLSQAFYEGLGRVIESAQDRILWRLENLNQAVATVVWAHGIGDEDFEQQGIAMVARVLSRDFAPETIQGWPTRDS